MRRFSSRAIDSAMTFLVGQLEFLDPIIRDPLHAEMYAKYLPIKTGAGWVENTSFRVITPAGVAQKPGSNRSDVIRQIGVDAKKVPTAVYDYQAGISYTVSELNRSAYAGLNLDDLKTRMLRLDYEKMVDRIAFCGDPDTGIPGLIGGRATVGSQAPYTYNVAAGVGGYTWALKTADEILTDLSTLLTTFRQKTGYAAWPNMIAIPEAQFQQIAIQKISSLGFRSILDYFLENNAASKAGVALKVVPNKWCTRQLIEGTYYGGGTSTYDRMCAYINDETYTRFHLPVPLTREDVTKVNLKISVDYIGVIGGVEIFHPETIIYADRI